MNCNTKLEAITDKTLIIGIDIAKKVHVARVFDNRGAELRARINVKNSRDGFHSFSENINELTRLHNKESVIIGLEPTGVYGHALTAFLKDEGYNVVYVLGMQVKRVKEVEDNSPSKNDYKDAKVIASLVKDGHYREIRDFTDDIAELREATSHAYQLTKKLTRIKCQIDTSLTQYFPEFQEAFKNTSLKTAMITLRLFPLPAQINALSAEEIARAWRDHGVIKGIGVKKAERLKYLAENTIGIKTSESTIIHFRDLMDEYNTLLRQEARIWERISELLGANADFHMIMGIGNVSPKMAAYLLAEVGDLRDFSHPQQVVRLAGLNLKESSSGKNRGTSEITKRGRPKLRRILYFIVLEQIKRAAPGWYQLHKHYTTRRNNPLKKMQSVIALCCKFLRVVWGVITTATPYDPDIFVGSKNIS